MLGFVRDVHGFIFVREIALGTDRLQPFGVVQLGAEVGQRVRVDYS
jgi:hypothetical protein